MLTRMGHFVAILMVTALPAIFTEQLPDAQTPGILNPTEPVLSKVTEGVKDTGSNVTIQVKSSTGPKAMNISQDFLNFLSANHSVSTRFASCSSTCPETLTYLRHLQEHYNYRSLFEMYYYVSVTRECYCHENYPYDDKDSSSGNPLVDFFVEIAGNFDNRPINGGDRSCRWTNVIFWLIRLIHCGVFDLRGISPREACYDLFECICEY